MELKFQYNKVTRQKFQAAIKARLRALPVLRAREALLRIEVKNRKKIIQELEKELADLKIPVYENLKLWSEFPDLVHVEKIEYEKKSIAGVPIILYSGVIFDVRWYSVFDEPKWFLEGVNTIKNILAKQIQLEVEHESLARLAIAGKKTTQKVNLYEKVQIPAYNQAILQIKRYLEDEENLSFAGQKIIKKRMSA
ncbi:MAG: V-type ATP synthase subunit D [Spirochaetia bacterium]|nr:V-type ATP synthase subunit D [Spirochaetia bacterium]